MGCYDVADARNRRTSSRKCRFQITVEDDLNYDGDKERFSREIAFWGRRGGQMIYKNVSQETVKIETELAPSSAA